MSGMYLRHLASCIDLVLTEDVTETLTFSTLIDICVFILTSVFGKFLSKVNLK